MMINRSERLLLVKDKRPQWLRKKIDFAACRSIDALTRELRLHTVCREAFCPNISDCFNNGVATFLILGNTCTRDCRFCAVPKGAPQGIDADEPRRVAEAVRRLSLEHVVITSVTRDDLPDGGAEMFAETIRLIRAIRDGMTIEVLVPDFQGSAESVRIVIDAHPEVFAHNLETVPRLYKAARGKASYSRSLCVLKTAASLRDDIFIKSGIMLGLGEREEEVLGVFDDLRSTRCQFLSIGQYLSPSERHLPVHEYVPPERFEYYKARAIEKGFLAVASGPYVRSSYLAHQYLSR